MVEGRDVILRDVTVEVDVGDQKRMQKPTVEVPGVQINLAFMPTSSGMSGVG